MYTAKQQNNLITLENQWLKIELDIANLRGEILFKPTRDRYALDLDRTAGVQIGKPGPEAATSLGPLGRLVKTDLVGQRAILRFERDQVCFEAGCYLEPDQPDFVCFIHPVSYGKDVVVKASFPGAIAPLQKSKVRFIIPIQQGVLMEEGDSAEFASPAGQELHGEELVTRMREGKREDFAGTPLVLQSNFWGVLGERSSIMAIMETPFDAALQLNGGRLSRPIWQPSLGHLRYERKCRYRFLATGSYVDVARAYREHLDRQGLCKTLKAKAEERPALRKALGACYIVLGYFHDPRADYLEILRKLKKRGIEKALCSCAYTYLLGADYTYLRGAPCTDLRASANEIRALGYLFGAFPNYGLMSPEYAGYDARQMLKDFNQREKEGFRLNDMIFNERCRAVMAYNNIPHEDFWKDVDFLDFDQAIGWQHECYDPLHPHDHRHAFECVKLIFERALSQGLVLMGEAHDDERIPYFDLMRTKSLAHVGRVPSWMGFPNKGWTIPLTELMFHDCFAHTWWEGDSYDNVHNHPVVGGNPEQQAVQDVLFGEPPCIFPVGSLYAPDCADAGRNHLFSQQWDDPLVQKSVDLAATVCREIKPVVTDKMLSHRFLDGEGYGQETVFESGRRVVANVGQTAKEADGTVLPPNSWKIY